MPDPPIDWNHALIGLGVALGAGLLIGLERERGHGQGESARFGGVRTFALVALYGGMSGLLSLALGVWPAAALLLLPGLMLVASAWLGLSRIPSRGITTEMAAVLTMLLGFAALTPLPGLSPIARWSLVAAAAVSAMAILALRRPLHLLAERIADVEIYAAGQLGVLLLIVLPLLPDRQVGPVEPFNPREIGLMVTLIAAIGFAGYIAMRLIGARRGMLVTGLLGGMVSSTAVTLEFSGRARRNVDLTAAAAAGITLASALMFPRQLLEVAVVDDRLVGPALLPIGGMGAAAVLMTLVLTFRRKPPGEAHEGLDVRNPFTLAAALKFGAIYVGVLVLAHWAQRAFGDAGLYVSALVAGITDVDAITLTISRLHREGLATEPAVTALVLAAGANTITKGIIAASVGGWRLGARVALVFGPTVLVGLIVSLGAALLS
ncbi:MAG: MgtC/SapB family protein [Myxococcales bacterium]|nr:MgtC/SapB family protein [Myxococcales bacterium]